jgi:hypothetical protein
MRRTQINKGVQNETFSTQLTRNYGSVCALDQHSPLATPQLDKPLTVDMHDEFQHASHPVELVALYMGPQSELLLLLSIAGPYQVCNLALDGPFERVVVAVVECLFDCQQDLNLHLQTIQRTRTKTL